MTTKYRHAAKVAEERILELTQQFKKGVKTPPRVDPEEASSDTSTVATTPTEGDGSTPGSQSASKETDSESAPTGIGGSSGTKN